MRTIIEARLEDGQGARHANPSRLPSSIGQTKTSGRWALRWKIITGERVSLQGARKAPCIYRGGRYIRFTKPTPSSPRAKSALMSNCNQVPNTDRLCETSRPKVQQLATPTGVETRGLLLVSHRARPAPRREAGGVGV